MTCGQTLQKMMWKEDQKIGICQEKRRIKILSIDDFPFWTVIIAPMAYFFKTKISHSNRITALESDVTIIKEDLQKIDTLCDDVSYIKGLLDEHLRK